MELKSAHRLSGPTRPAVISGGITLPVCVCVCVEGVTECLEVRGEAVFLPAERDPICLHVSLVSSLSLLRCSVLSGSC